MAVLHFVLGVLVERARAVEDLLVPLVIVALGTRLTNSGDDVVWPVAAILARLGYFCSITAAVMMVTAVVVASVMGVVVVAVRWALSAHIFIEAHLGFLSVGVLVGSSDHLANACGWLTVELGAKLAMVESSDEGGDNFSFRDVGNRISHLRKVSDVTAEELGWLLIDTIEIILGARPSTHNHIIVG